MRSAQGGGGYPTNMPPELMQNPYSRLPYGQQGMGMGMYTQNQPLPPGRFMAHSLVIITFFSSLQYDTPFWQARTV